VTSEGADDLLSQLAGDEIDRLLAQAESSSNLDGEGPDSAADAPAKPSLDSAAPAAPEDAARKSAVSSFVGQGDPALESELDNLLGNLEAADTPVQGTDPATSPAPKPSSAAERADAALKNELDQVFDQMTAAQGPEAPAADSAPPASPPASPVSESPPAAAHAPVKPPGSIDLLKVLDPIVAKDAAAEHAQETAAAHASHHEAPEAPSMEENPPAAEGRPPFYVVILEMINSPLDGLSPEVRDMAGKIGIMTLINAAAILLYVLFFRRK
jgi:hypothetical protein